METARKWFLHEMRFEVLTPRKGIFIDGHEREDVQYWKFFLQRMIKIVFLHFMNAPTETALKANVAPSILGGTSTLPYPQPFLSVP